MKKKGSYPFLGVVILFHLIYFGWQLYADNHLLQDSSEYLHAARNLIESGTPYAGPLDQEVEQELFSKRPPGYPAFLALFQLINLPIAFVLLVQNALSICSLMLARQIFIQYGYHRKWDPWLLLLLLFSPAQFIYANMLMSEILLQFLIVLMVYCFTKTLRSKAAPWLFGLNIALAAALSVKPVMYPWLLPHSILLLFYFYKIKIPFYHMAWVFIPAIAVAVVMHHNHSKTGSMEFSSIQNINLVNYNAYYFEVQQSGLESATEELDSLHNSTETLPYSKRWEVRKDWALQTITGQPLSYLGFHLRGSMLFFIDPGRFDLQQFWGWPQRSETGFLQHFSERGIQGIITYLREHGGGTILLLIGLGALKVLLLIMGITYFVKKGFHHPPMVYTAALMVYLAIVTGPLGASRFALPILPFFIFMAVCAIPQLSKARKFVSKTLKKA